MFISVHASAGALIGQQVKNPILAFILAFASHFVLDMIPHGDQDWIDEYKDGEQTKVRKIIAIVALDGVVLATLLISKFFFIDSFMPSLNIAAGILGGVLPDLLVACHELSDRLFKNFYKFHFIMHDLIKVKQPSIVQSIAFQAVVLGAILFHFL
jgi:hypothetical protein